MPSHEYGYRGPFLLPPKRHNVLKVKGSSALDRQSNRLAGAVVPLIPSSTMPANPTPNGRFRDAHTACKNIWYVLG